MQMLVALPATNYANSKGNCLRAQNVVLILPLLPMMETSQPSSIIISVHGWVVRAYILDKMKLLSNVSLDISW